MVLVRKEISRIEQRHGTSGRTVHSFRYYQFAATNRVPCNRGVCWTSAFLFLAVRGARYSVRHRLHRYEAPMAFLFRSAGMAGETPQRQSSIRYTPGRL